MALPAASHSRDLTDEQWVLIGPFLPKLTRRKDGRGRPWRENRAVLNGILWILRTGAPWADLPDRYPSYQTCHRRFQQWVQCGVLKDILSVLAEALHDEGYLDLEEAFIDGSFAPAKKGGAGVGTTKRGKGSKIMAITDRHGRPVAIHIDSATPHEVTFVETTLAHRLVQKMPKRLIGDNAYESDQLDAELAQRGIELIAPHRRNRTHRTQDGRQLRRYRRRWKMERLFAWLQNYRRIVVRYERYPENFLGMLHLACWLILLRVFMGCLLLISFESDVGTSRGTGGVNPARAGLLRSPIADSLDAATKFSQTLVLALRRPGRRRAEAERLPVTSRYQSRSSSAFGKASHGARPVRCPIWQYASA